MKKMTIVLIGCFMYLFLFLLNTGYAQSPERFDGDFHVVFPQGDFVYLDDNNSLALFWCDAGFEAGQIYRVLISEDEFFKTPICSNWISNKIVWRLSSLIIKEIGLEPEKTYHWKAERFSQSQDGIISTDIGSFTTKETYGTKAPDGINVPGTLGTITGCTPDESVVIVSYPDRSIHEYFPRCLARGDNNECTAWYYSADMLEPGVYDVTAQGATLYDVQIDCGDWEFCHFCAWPPYCE